MDLQSIVGAGPCVAGERVNAIGIHVQQSHRGGISREQSGRQLASAELTSAIPIQIDRAERDRANPQRERENRDDAGAAYFVGETDPPTGIEATGFVEIWEQDRTARRYRIDTRTYAGSELKVLDPRRAIIACTHDAAISRTGNHRDSSAGDIQRLNTQPADVVRLRGLVRGC
jgi:hypothetical protein